MADCQKSVGAVADGPRLTPQRNGCCLPCEYVEVSFPWDSSVFPSSLGSPGMVLTILMCALGA